jgi:signal transduction histidine kinase
MTEDPRDKDGDVPTDESDVRLQAWRERVLLRLSTLILLLGTPTMCFLAWLHWNAGRWIPCVFSLAGIPLVLLVRVGRRLPFRVRAVLQIGVFLVGGIIGYLTAGLAGSGAAVFVAATVLAALLMGPRWGTAVLVTTVAAMAIIGALFVSRQVHAPDPSILDPTVASHWWRATTFYLVLSATILAVVVYLLGRLESSLRRSQDLVRELRKGMVERERLEANLLEAQKTRAIGTLAAGIAHDFNNILGGLISYAELARLASPDGSEQRTDIDQVLQAADRAKSLVSRILTASRQHEGERRPMRIQDVLGEILSLLRATLPTTIEMRSSVASGCPAILGDPTQIHRLVMNLCTNAVQAMRDRGGVLEVGLRTAERQPGRAAELWVRDTGCGMDEATKARIFEPYFTTRTKGEGSGLGLATVNNIVGTHGGTISVESEPDQGSTFSVLLPLCTSAPPPSPLPAPIDSPGGTERILFVDDEAQIADASRKALSRLGYQVTCFTSPESALEAFANPSVRFDLVITDLTMPGLNGAQFARRIRERHPDARIIVCTGLNEATYQADLDAIKVQRTLIKPVLAGELATAIRQVLDA